MNQHTLVNNVRLDDTLYYSESGFECFACYEPTDPEEANLYMRLLIKRIAKDCENYERVNKKLMINWEYLEPNAIASIIYIHDLRRERLNNKINNSV